VDTNALYLIGEDYLSRASLTRPAPRPGPYRSTFISGHGSEGGREHFAVAVQVPRRRLPGALTVIYTYGLPQVS